MAGPDSVDARDLSDLRAAQDQIRQAQAIYAFVSSRVAQRYGLTQADRIEDDGTIIRAAQGQGNG